MDAVNAGARPWPEPGVGSGQELRLAELMAAMSLATDITMGHFLPAEMFPNVFGHEGAGVVEEVGAGVRGLEPGDHVVMSFRSCRDCAKCHKWMMADNRTAIPPCLRAFPELVVLAAPANE